MKKLLYLASASHGDREKLRELQLLLSTSSFMVYSPCLGFCGTESESLRSRIMAHCLRMVSDSDVFLGYLEGAPTDGLWQEVALAQEAHKPLAFLVTQRVYAIPTKYVNENVFFDSKHVSRWLHELS